MPPHLADRVHFRPLHVSQSTFKGGVTLGCHRWFRLTPSFGPELVQHALRTFGERPDRVVLDPFSGAGTTAIECHLHDIRCHGFEINPMLQFVCSTSIASPGAARMLEDRLAQIGARVDRLRGELERTQLEHTGLRIPTIHNVFRWWRRDVLKDLLIIRDSIDVVTDGDPRARDFFRLALAGILVPDLTNVTLSRLQLHFIDRSEDRIDAWQSFAHHTRQMIADVDELEARPRHNAQEVLLADSTQPPAAAADWQIDTVITSPPYPNRYSYVWNTRPHLFFFEYFHGRTEATKLDKRTIGGTWGTATAILSKGIIEPAYPIVGRVVGPVADRIRQRDNLMANYLMKYFNLLAKQIVAMEPLLAPRVQTAYVVGNSRLKGVYVPTDILLAEVFEGLGLGYRVDAVERFRRRHSGHNLYETIVFAHKGG